MPFSASTCLTNTGTTTLGPTFKVYANPISPTSPGTYLMDVPTSSITGGNCPYTFIVPDGTTSVRLFDPVSFCYADVPVSSNNVCTTCNLSLNSVSNNLIGQINVGSLTGTCDTSIGDYTMSWYGPNSTTNLAFTSGQGTVFNGLYQYTHPLTSTNSPLLEPGAYIGRITRTDLNGVKFSSTGGTGNVLSPSLTNCVTNVNVATYSCANNNNPLYNGYYGHYRNFVYNGSVEPSTLRTKLQLTAGTPYVIFSFQANTVPDTIKFTLSGSAYSTPIQLDECTVGAGITNNFTPTTWPKLINTTGGFKKILTLTGLTINNNDIIDIQISQPTSNPQTNWSLFFGCSTRPTGSKNCLDNYKNKPYPIKLSSILPNEGTSSCPKFLNLSFDVSGCTNTQNSTWFNSSLYYLTRTNATLEGEISTNDSTSALTVTYNDLYGTYNTLTNNSLFDTTTVCQTTTGADVRVEKVGGTNPSLTYYFKNMADFNIINDSYIARKNQLSNYITPGVGGGVYSTNNTSLNYYRYLEVKIPINSICGDGASFTYQSIPLNTTTMSGPTTYEGYTYYLKLTLPIQTYNPAACSGYCGCFALSYVVDDRLNPDITGDTFTYTTTTILSNSFYYGVYSRVVSDQRLQQTRQGTFFYDFRYADNTYPASGGTNFNSSLLPSLPNGSGVYDWENHFNVFGGTLFQTLYYYTVRIKTPITSPFGYEIWAYNISNFTTIGSEIKIYDSVTGVQPGQSAFFY